MENKGVLLTYHYREVPLEKRNELVERARQLIIDSGFVVSSFYLLVLTKVDSLINLSLVI